jgi:hypothetical protein
MWHIGCNYPLHANSTRSSMYPYENPTHNIIPDRTPPPPPPIEIKGDEEFEVHQNLDSKISRRHLYYLVDWEGYAPCDRTWEPVEILANASDKVAAFHARYPTKARSIGLGGG